MSEEQTIEERLQRLEEIVILPEQTLADVVGINYLTIQEALTRIGDFVYNQQTAYEYFLSEIAELISPQYQRIQKDSEEIDIERNFKIIQGEKETDPPSLA
jgi:hypothetical protein|tara:strand:+ start:411 stop:713 length:303 start_codon:yes stop_codon:yes gene_type:complete